MSTPDPLARLRARSEGADPLARFRERAGMVTPAEPEPEGPGLLRTIGQDFGHLAHLFRGTMPSDAPIYDPSIAALPHEKPSTDDLVGGSRAAASLLFPIGVGAETAVGGAVGALAGEPDAFQHAYEEGAFGPIKRALGLDKKIEALRPEHPYLAAGADIAGTLAGSIGAEGGARALGRAALSPLRKATDIGEEVAAAFKSLTPEDMPGNPGAVDASLRPATMPDQMHQRLDRPRLGAGPPVREEPLGPAIPMGPPLSEQSTAGMLDPTRPNAVPIVPGEPLLQPGRGLSFRDRPPIQTPDELIDEARVQQDAARPLQRAANEENLAVRQRLGALGMDYAGTVRGRVMAALARFGAGAAAGGTQGDTPQEHAVNALGAGTALALAPAGYRALRTGADALLEASAHPGTLESAASAPEIETRLASLKRQVADEGAQGADGVEARLAALKKRASSDRRLSVEDRMARRKAADAEALRTAPERLVEAVARPAAGFEARITQLALNSDHAARVAMREAAEHLKQIAIQEGDNALADRAASASQRLLHAPYSTTIGRPEGSTRLVAHALNLVDGLTRPADMRDQMGNLAHVYEAASAAERSEIDDALDAVVHEITPAHAEQLQNARGRWQVDALTAGKANPAVVRTLARTGAGAAVGGALDAAEGDDSPFEGALAGAAAGAALRPELWDRLVGVKNVAATKLWEKNETLGHFFATGHTLPEGYRAARQAMDRGIHESRMVAEEVHNRVKEYPEAVQKLLSDLADEGASPADIERKMALAGHAGGPEAAKVVADVHSLFAGLGDQLFKLGQLSEESLDKYGGRYLPRYYRAAESGGRDATRSAFLQPREGKVRLDSDALGRLKQRADVVSPEMEARRIDHFGQRAVTGAIQEGELAAKEGFFQAVKGMDDVVHPGFRDSHDQLRELEQLKRAARTAESKAGLEGNAKVARAEKQRLNDEIDALKERQAVAAKEAQAKGFVQLPGDKRLGSLAGTYVRKDVAEDLNGLARPAHLYGSLVDGYDKWMRRWKKGKTVYNPATHGRNIVGAQFLSWLGGGPMPFSPTYFKALGVVRGKQGELYREARMTGLLDSSFAKEQMQSLGRTVAGEDASITGRLRAGGGEVASPGEIEAGGLANRAAAVAGAGKGRLARLDDKLTDVYHQEDLTARVAHFIHLRKQGVGMEEAAASAKKWVPTFHNLSNATRAWSRVEPFFSYTAAALPLAAEASVKNPVRFLAAGALSYALGKQVFGDDVPEQVLPREMQGPLGAPVEGQPVRNTVKRMAAGAVPTFIPLGQDKDHRRTYLDATYIMPWGDIAENRGGGHGPLDAIPQQFNPISNPLVGTLAALGLNRDRLTGKDLTRPSMTGGEKAGVAADYLYKQALPSLAPGIPGTGIHGGWGAQKLHDAFAGTPNWYGEVRSPASAVLDVLAGMKQRQVLPSREYASRFRDVRKEVEDLRARVVEVYRDPRISEQEKEKFRAAAAQQMDRLSQEADQLSSLRGRIPGAQ